MVERYGVWGVAMVAVAATMLLVQDAGLSFVLYAGSLIPVLCLGLSAIVPRATASRRAVMMADMLEVWALFAVVAACGAIASYAIAAGSDGFADAMLASADRMAGFDWVALYRAMAASSFWTAIGPPLYRSIVVSPLIVIAGLVLTGRTARARDFVVVFAIALAVTLMLFAVLPARSALVYHLGGDVPYMPATGIHHVDIIAGLRAGTLRSIDTLAMAGLVTFPSFHVVSAVLFIWAVRPVAVLRWIVWGVNVGMIVVTPVQGTHYLVDVVGGLGVALVGIAMLRLPGAAGRRLAVPSARAGRPATA